MMLRKVKCRLGPILRGVISQRALSSGLRDPVAGIGWSRWSDESTDSFDLGFYERSELPIVDPVVLADVDGCEILFVQSWIVDQLEGGEIEIRDGKIELTDVEGTIHR